MSTRKFLPKILVALLAAAAFVQAPAASFSESLIGNVADISTSTFAFGSNQYLRYDLDLSGMSPILVSQGDTISFNVTLSSPFTLQGSSLPGAYNEYLLYGMGTGFPSVNTGVAGSFTLLDGGTNAGVLSTNSTSNGVLSLYAVDGATTRSFDQLQVTMLVSSLPTSGPVQLDRAHLTLDQVSPVPEPSSALMVGAGLIAFVMIARRRHG